MENKPELVHFQITRHCNLRCYFCGQWGKKGFFSDAAGSDLSLEDWKTLALKLKQSYEPLPHIILWGGEPLVCPFFDELVMFLKKEGFTLGMVTNGVLLDKHMELCKSSFKTIYVSIDGPEKIHDSIRGKGVFEKVSKNLMELSSSDVNVVVMSVLSPALLGELQDFPKLIAALGADELYLQDYIRLSEDEADDYKKWMKDSFGINAKEIESWVTQMPADYDESKKTALDAILAKEHDIPVTYACHRNDECKCLSPHKHIHVSWNGNVMYCTDFYDFSAGNIKSDEISEIFNNEVSQKFRAELSKNPACRHCSWKNNKSFYL